LTKKHILIIISKRGRTGTRGRAQELRLAPDENLISMYLKKLNLLLPF